MSLPIRTQRFVVEVSTSIMPRMTEQELHDVVLKLAFEKESRHGMGALGVHVREALPYDYDYDQELGDATPEWAQ